MTGLVRVSRLSFHFLWLCPNPSIITGDKQQPDFAIFKGDDLLLLELTVGFQTNSKNILIITLSQVVCWAFKYINYVNYLIM